MSIIKVIAFFSLEAMLLLYIFGSMLKIGHRYKKYKNGIIFTLIFHIIVFIILNISQFKVKKEFKEAEILINFPTEIIEKQLENSITTKTQITSPSNFNTQTNIASNKSIDYKRNIFDEAYQKELQEVQSLVRDVSHQLSKEIPTIDDLQMPEETTEHLNPDSIKNKLYNGDSNVEYYLKDRYHLRLPIPVYLSQYEGNITVNIVVDPKGNVIEANPIITNNSNEQQLSYAKTAAMRTQFNSSSKIKSLQKGYIKYHFIAQ